MAKRPDWSRRLPRALVIPKVMKIATLADVRELMRHLPTDYRNRSTWQQVAAELDKAAAGGEVEDSHCAALGVNFGTCRVPSELTEEEIRRGCRR